jgi:hypothetical protein
MLNLDAIAEGLRKWDLLSNRFSSTDISVNKMSKNNADFKKI